MDKRKKAQDTIKKLEDGVADAYLKIEDGIYTAYTTLEAGALHVADALMDFCEEVFLSNGEDKEPPPKDKT